MLRELFRYEMPYIDMQGLGVLLQEYKNPNDLIWRLVKSGDLIRLKNGFFVIAEKIRKSPVPFPQLANLLYGPSYLSFEWALSHYGMIPEGVYVMTSASVMKSKRFDTPLGAFAYQYLSHVRYSIGIDQKENFAGRFLIATPEKALADLIHCKSRGLESTQDMLIDLVEARRIDEDRLKQLDKKHMRELERTYRSRAVKQLTDALEML